MSRSGLRVMRAVGGLVLVELALAGPAAAQPKVPPTTTKGEPTVALGPLHPKTAYKVNLQVDNKCTWTQQATVTKAGGNYGAGVDLPWKDLPPQKISTFELAAGNAEMIFGIFSNAALRIKFDHPETSRHQKIFCMARTVVFDTGAEKDDKPLEGPVTLAFPLIVLQQVGRDDYDAKKYLEPDRATTVDKENAKKQPGETPKKTSMRKALPWVGGGAALIAGAVALGGGGGSDAPAAPSTPLPSPPTGLLFCGTYTGQLEPTQVACGFSSAFPMVVELGCSSNGSARLVIRRADNDPQGQRFEYTGTISPAGVLDFSGSGNLRGQATYTGHFTGVISGNGTTFEGTNTVTFTDPCRGQTLVQRVTGTRSN